MMVQFPVWLDARTKGGDNFPLLWVDSHNPLGTRGIAGTFWYTAPEVFRYERYSFGVDYWSVGLIYHELTTGHVSLLFFIKFSTHSFLSKIPFNHHRPYPQDKRPVIDFRTKPGQLKDVTLWEQRALMQVRSELFDTNIMPTDVYITTANLSDTSSCTRRTASNSD